MSGLDEEGRMVRVGPPLFERDPSRRLAPNGRLLPLVGEKLKPLGLPTALKLTLVVVCASALMSGELGLLLPEMTEFVTVMEPGRKPKDVFLKTPPPP